MLLVSRQKAIHIRSHVTIAPLTRTSRGLPSEVPLETSDGVPKPCAVNLDSLQTIRKSLLINRVCALSQAKLASVAEALKFALGLD